eukprot:TRINITY_DN15396_c0_g1_i3.p1 TRINITY_DN15396_c0_g1~~TRINITY_DN15396_c0_g1_i3.p1  ORF type:complete len:473 (-),score=40.58 TRINITY_DN15396_c0_g1_i3:374-1792(-)
MTTRRAQLGLLMQSIWPLCLGHFLEWYEFGVYGSVAPNLKHAFFHESALATWMGFAVTFALRPVGGVINGCIADRFGRRKAVLISLLGMLIATVGQGLLPSHSCCGESAGTVGMVLLLCFRAIQGLSAGGEFGPVISFFGEKAPSGLICTSIGLLTTSCYVGFLAANGLVSLLAGILGSAMNTWGWRIPFLVALVPGSISLWGRVHLTESEDFLMMKVQQKETPAMSCSGSVRHLVRNHGPALLVGFVGNFGAPVALYSAIWCQSYLVSRGMEQAVALGVGSMHLAICAFLNFVIPLLNDVYASYDPLLLVTAGMALQTMLGVLVFWALSHAVDLLFMAIMMLGLIWSLVVGINGSHLYVWTADLFPTEYRALGIGLTLNLAFAFLGGSASLVNVQAVRLAPEVGPGLYWSLVSLFSTVALLCGYCARRHGKLARYLTVKQGANTKQSEAETPKQVLNGKSDVCDITTDVAV